MTSSNQPSSDMATSVIYFRTAIEQYVKETSAHSNDLLAVSFDDVPGEAPRLVFLQAPEPDVRDEEITGLTQRFIEVLDSVTDESWTDKLGLVFSKYFAAPIKKLSTDPVVAGTSPTARVVTNIARYVSTKLGRQDIDTPRVFAFTVRDDVVGVFEMPFDSSVLLTDARLDRIKYAMTYMKYTPTHAVYVEDPVEKKYLLVTTDKQVTELGGDTKLLAEKNPGTHLLVAEYKSAWDRVFEEDIPSPKEGDWAFAFIDSDHAAVLSTTSTKTGPGDIPLLVYIKDAPNTPGGYVTAVLKEAPHD